MNINKADFLKSRPDFSLGDLVTEGFHPLTKNLSELANTNLIEAIQTIQQVDILALNKSINYIEQIFELHLKCQEVLNSGGRVFISGCGATGRLALTIEKIFGELYGVGRVVAFMAGGDYALIKSVESFEDNKQFGERQLEELNFGVKDILIGVTEGGETSFVIGTIEKAATLSKHKPYFIYCNSDIKLKRIRRSLELIERDDIKKINLTVGEMALSGSTRMQASTVQMLAVGFSVLYKFESLDEFSKKYKEFISSLCGTNFSGIFKLIMCEEQVYRSGGVVTYEVPSELAITVLTDTTERCPTFNLAPFEKIGDKSLSLSHLCIKGLEDNSECWELLLGRPPRNLDWNELNHEVCLDEILKFNLSGHNLKYRQKVNPKMEKFSIHNHRETIALELGSTSFNLKLGQGDLFFRHMVLKLALNIHSTLVMGRLNRFEGNMMTYVRPSNLKLIDRCIRYIKQLLLTAGLDIKEELIIDRLFEELESSSTYLAESDASIESNQGIVIRVRDQILEKNN